MPGTTPRADVWVVVEHPGGWREAPLARAEHGVRVLMARGQPSDRRSADRRLAEGTRADPSQSAFGRGDQAFRVWVADCRGPSLRVGSVQDPSDVGFWDLNAIHAGSHADWGRPETEPLLLVCANGRRDPCCGTKGLALARELRSGADAPRVLTCTHLGGHRFAPTALLLPFGVMHGRLDVAGASELLPLARAGRTPTTTLRGFSEQAEALQVAEAAVRLHIGYAGIVPLRVRIMRSPPVSGVEETPDLHRLLVAVEVPADSDELGQSSDPVVQHRPEILVELVRTPQAVTPSCGQAATALDRWHLA